MCNIDRIMEIISWEQSSENQEKGIKQAMHVESINFFLQPRNTRYNKNVWENCAKILAFKTDEELSPYLIELMSWLQDMNWPGSFCILERLGRFGNRCQIERAMKITNTIATAVGDNVWQQNLLMINCATQKR